MYEITFTTISVLHTTIYYICIHTLHVLCIYSYINTRIIQNGRGGEAHRLCTHRPVLSRGKLSKHAVAHIYKYI